MTPQLAASSARVIREARRTAGSGDAPADVVRKAILGNTQIDPINSKGRAGIHPIAADPKEVRPGNRNCKSTPCEFVVVTAGAGLPESVGDISLSEQTGENPVFLTDGYYGNIGPEYIDGIWSIDEQEWKLDRAGCKEYPWHTLEFPDTEVQFELGNVLLCPGFVR